MEMVRVTTAFAFAVVTATLVGLAVRTEAVHLFAKGSAFHAANAGDEHTPEAAPPRWRYVHQATSASDFHRALASEPLAVVFFHAPWSVSSVEFYETLDEKVAKPLAKRPAVPVIAVDVSEVPDIGKEYRINSFPTFGAYRYGAVAASSETQFPRHAAGVVKHVRNLLKPATEPIATVSELSALVDKKTLMPVAPAKDPDVARRHPDDATEHTVIVGFLANAANQMAFDDVARFLGSYFRFAVVADAAVAKAYGQELDSIVIFRRWGDRTPVVRPIPAGSGIHLEEVSRFLIYSAVHPMGVFDDDTRAVYTQRYKPLLLYVAPVQMAEADPLFGGFAALHNDEAANVTVAQLNPNVAGKTIVGFLGLQDALLEQNWAVGLLVGRKKYRFDAGSLPPTEANLRAFVEAAVAGAYPEHHKSETRSRIADVGSGDVSDLAYVDFETKIVNDSARDAVILMYHPRNRACQDLLPVFEDLAVELKDVSGLVVGRMNVYENDYHDSYATVGYPSILYARRDDKTHPVRMTSVARTVDHIKEFIVKHAAVSLGTLAPSNQTPGTSMRSNVEAQSSTDEL